MKYHTYLTVKKYVFKVSQIAQAGGVGNKVLSVINIRLDMYMQFMRLQFPTKRS